MIYLIRESVSSGALFNIKCNHVNHGITISSELQKLTGSIFGTWFWVLVFNHGLWALVWLKSLVIDLLHCTACLAQICCEPLYFYHALLDSGFISSGLDLLVLTFTRYPFFVSKFCNSFYFTRIFLLCIVSYSYFAWICLHVVFADLHKQCSGL